MPEIRFVDPDTKEWRQFDINEALTLGRSSENGIKLSEVEGVEDKHISIFLDEEEGYYFLKNLGETTIFINHSTRKESLFLDTSEKTKLGKKARISFGINPKEKSSLPSLTLFWGDEECHEEYIPKYQKLKVDQAKDEILETEVDKLILEFHNKLRGTEPRLAEVSRSICKYLVSMFSDISAAIIYRNMANRWRAVASIYSGVLEKTSSTLFYKAVQERAPLLARLSTEGIEIGDEKIEASVSLLETKAKRIVVIPLFQGDKTFGVLYLDSKTEDFDAREYDIIWRLFNVKGLSAVLAGYLKEEPDEINFLRVKKELLPQRWGWRFYVGREKGYPVVCMRANENIGEGRVLYGFCGDNIKHVTKIKSFIMGMQAGTLIFDEPSYLTEVNQFLEYISDKDKLNLVDIAFKFAPILEDSTNKENIDESLPLRSISLDNKGNTKEVIRNIQGVAQQPFSLKFSYSGKLYIYLQKKGNVKTILEGENEEDINYFDVAEMEIGDCLVVSPFYRISRNVLRDLSINNLRRTIRDFMILVRER